GDCLRDRHAIRVLQRAADRQPTSRPGDTHAVRPEQLLEVERRRLPLDTRVRGHDHLPHPAPLTDPAGEGLEVELRRADPLEWREPPTEYVIEAAKGAGPLDRTYVCGLLDDADQRPITLWAGADRAGVRLAEVPALAARVHLLRDRQERLRQTPRFLRWPLQQMVRQPERRLPTDSREPRELRGEVVDRRHQGSCGNGKGDGNPPATF